MTRILIISLVVLVACSSQIRVFSDYDPGYDLRSYKTFDWGEKVKIEQGKNPLHYNELNDKRIKAAVLEEMISRGYQQTEDAPELILHYHIIVDDRSVVTTEPYGYQYGPYWTRSNANFYSYREGTLILDLMDRKTQNLIWRGWAVTDIDGITPKEVEAIIKSAVAKIFKKYPKAPVTLKTSKEVVSN